MCVSLSVLCVQSTLVAMMIVFKVFLHLVLIRPIIWSACHFSLIGKLVGRKGIKALIPFLAGVLLALFPSPTQLSVTCSTLFRTAGDGKLGGAWE